jgi:hypothetical protein
VVLSNLGFGLWTDYLMCFFWGFGLPTGATQLAQLTPGTIATSLGISLAR